MQKYIGINEYLKFYVGYFVIKENQQYVQICNNAFLDNDTEVIAEFSEF